MAIDDDRRIGLLLTQDEVERLADLAKLRRGEVGLAPHRGKARGEQQRIVLAQRHVERGGEANDHVAAGRGSSQL